MEAVAEEIKEPSLHTDADEAGFFGMDWDTIPMIIFRNKELSAEEKIVYAVVIHLRHYEEEGVFPTFGEIAKGAGIKKVRAKELVEQMTEKGLFRIVEDEEDE